MASLARGPCYPRSVLLGGRLILLNPADDVEFVAWTRQMAAGPAVDPAGLQDLLRVRYPAAVVRRRDLSNEQAEIWYVYRDGRWVPHPGASSPAAG